MTDHVHGCLNCRPDMVPDFTRDDPRYHDGEKCGPGIMATVDGKATGYTKGLYEGLDGWVLLASRDLDASQIHECPTCTVRDAEGVIVGRMPLCVVAAFGTVTVVHECPSVTVARAKRLEEVLRPFVPESTLHLVKYGRERVR